MSPRTLAGFVSGCVLWWFLFLAIAIGLGMLWPAYREAGRFVFSEGDFSHLSTPMLFLNLLVFVAAGLVVGRLVPLISGNRIPALAVALLYLLYAGFEHSWVLWDKLPGWYSVFAPLIIFWGIALGSRFFRLGTSSSARPVG